jgi:Domain of Unknown Function (DUF1206)
VAQNGSSVGQHAERAHPWIERLARFGYVAYGVVYLLVGVLSVQATLGGALETLARQPFGPYLPGAVAIGRSFSSY